MVNGRHARATSLALLCALAAPGERGVLAHSPSVPQAAAGTSQRAADRLKDLQREADELATQEKSLLAELRRLEIDRQVKGEELARIEQDLRATEERIAAARARTAALQNAARTQQPGVEARLVRLYKLGAAGYWRLLLDVDDAQSIGRAYRTAAALTRLDVQQVRQHEGTLKSLAAERAALEEHARKSAALRDQASSARAAIDRAVASQSALIASIDQRRDLTARLAGELAAAQQKLQVSIGQAAPATVTALPLRPFKGSLPWPADGFVLTRFGRQRVGAGGTDLVRNGIEISLAEGRPVTAVHDGVVTYAAPFTGYGTLVIVDHGDGAHTLYGHLSALAVNKGDRVQPRTKLGVSGRNPAGNPALYFELRVDGKPVDPLQWLKKQP
jgi:septal ring factor EnvC (AmiA/AmiB activator)